MSSVNRHYQSKECSKEIFGHHTLTTRHQIAPEHLFPRNVPVDSREASIRTLMDQMRQC